MEFMSETIGPEVYANLFSVRDCVKDREVSILTVHTKSVWSVDFDPLIRRRSPSLKLCFHQCSWSECVDSEVA